MSKINRKALVERHKIVINEPDKRAPLTVGNGSFGFTADVTGLQTFPQFYRYEQPLCTLSEWGWHSFPTPEYLKDQEFVMKEYKTGDRMVPYLVPVEGESVLYGFLRANPHRFHLGMVGFRFLEKTEISDLTDIHQELDMYTGVITSKFKVRGVPVEVETCAMYDKDAIGVKVKSPLLTYGNLRVKIEFPYAANAAEINAAAAEYSVCDGNYSEIINRHESFSVFKRNIDDTEYFAGLNCANAGLYVANVNCYELIKFFGDEMSFVLQFSKNNDVVEGFTFEDAVNSSKKALENFWENGGIIDFGNCDDPKAKELEDRMVKSMYITRINSCSATPPQESGFTCNSGWWGKSHTEMHYWHAAYFPLWSRPELLEKSMTGYLKYMDKCEAIAKRQGYKGIRIPKIIDNEFNETPAVIAPMLLWEQPHPTMMAELIYRANPKKEILERYFELVERTCEFMLDFLSYDEKIDKYILDAPYILAQEYHLPEDVKNGVYELEYWHFALTTYKEWCKRLGKTPLADLDEKLDKLVMPPIIDGLYPAHENCPETYTKFNYDHPSMLCAYGVLPGWRMDEKIVRATLDKIMQVWKWDETWGWDYALLAMCASKLGDSKTALDVLLMDSVKNTYSKNGHVYQYPSLPCYIDTNASFLLALGFIAAGCDSNPKCMFPQDWDVKVEDILKHV